MSTTTVGPGRGASSHGFGRSRKLRFSVISPTIWADTDIEHGPATHPYESSDASSWQKALFTHSNRAFFDASGQIGRAHVSTPVTNATLVCRLLLANHNIIHTYLDIIHTT